MATFPLFKPVPNANWNYQANQAPTQPQAPPLFLPNSPIMNFWRALNTQPTASGMGVNNVPANPYYATTVVPNYASNTSPYSEPMNGGYNPTGLTGAEGGTPWRAGVNQPPTKTTTGTSGQPGTTQPAPTASTPTGQAWQAMSDQQRYWWYRYVNDKPTPWYATREKKGGHQFLYHGAGVAGGPKQYDSGQSGLRGNAFWGEKTYGPSYGENNQTNNNNQPYQNYGPRWQQNMVMWRP